jgi:hypothetical protein
MTDQQVRAREVERRLLVCNSPNSAPRCLHPVQEQRKRQRRSLDDGVAQQPSSGGTGGAGAVAASSNPIVLVWDLDETLLVFNSLLIGTWAVATQNPAAADDLRKLGQRWEAAILALCDDHFFFDQVSVRLQGFTGHGISLC